MLSTMKTFPETGVGMVYLPGLQQLIEPHLGLMHVLEIEPQTLWYCNDLDGDSIRLNREQNELLQSYPLPKLFHSVGLPVGSILLPTDTQMQALQEHVSILSPLGISEHLSFNNFIH